MDKQRCMIFVAMQNACFEGRGSIEFGSFMIKHGLTEAFEDLMNDFGEKEHERGWCKDPECHYGEDKEDD